jgi:hypothetical protein
VHGETSAMENLSQSLTEENYKVEIAKKGLTYLLE